MQKLWARASFCSYQVKNWARSRKVEGTPRLWMIFSWRCCQGVLRQVASRTTKGTCLHLTTAHQAAPGQLNQSGIPTDHATHHFPMPVEETQNQGLGFPQPNELDHLHSTPQINDASRMVHVNDRVNRTKVMEGRDGEVLVMHSRLRHYMYLYTCKRYNNAKQHSGKTRHVLLIGRKVLA